MKFGIFLLIFGLILAGIGIAAWQYGTMQPHIVPRYNDAPDNSRDLGIAFGLGLTVLGGGLAFVNSQVNFPLTA